MILISLIGNKNIRIKISRPLPYKGRVLSMILKFLIIGSLYLNTTCNIKNNNEMDLKTKENIEEGKIEDEKQQPVYLAGALELVPNPCLTQPCLPGQVYSLLYENTYYILTIDGEWCWGTDTFKWNDIQLVPGEKLMIEGQISEHQDIKNKIYLQLNIKSLKKR